MASYQRQNKRNNIGKPKKRGGKLREKNWKKTKTNETKTRTFKQFFFVIIKRDRIDSLSNWCEFSNRRMQVNNQ